MSKILIIALLVLAVCSVRPPAPICRPTPLPSLIPVSIGETVRLDLENIFDGYNLVFEGAPKEHITIQPKYLVNSTSFGNSFNFSMVKIKGHNRFLGLTTNNQYTQLAIGTNHPESGVVIEKVLQIQDIPQLRCYDVDEIFDSVNNASYAIIDCGLMRFGELRRNQFLFVDLATYKLVQGSRVSDVFVNFNHLIRRNIEVISDPFTHVQYILRFYTAQGVDAQHSGQTFVQILLHTGTIMQIQIFDVIDHTVLDLPELAIMDYQIHMNFIYLLVRDTGVYQLQFSPTQRLTRTAYFPIKMNVNRFRIQQNGFNDDLHVVLSNDNTVYQYQWDILAYPVLMTKYTLMGGSTVEELLIDENFVIVQTWALVDTQLERRTFIFSRKTPSYTHAFGSFLQPSTGPSILIYHAWERTLHMIHEYKSFNIRLSLPYLFNHPMNRKAGETQSYVVKATSSTGQGGTKVECRQTLNFIYIENTDKTIFKTSLQPRAQMIVDAPDDITIDLQYEFFGRNISYDVKFALDNVTNSSFIPEHYIEKEVKAKLNFPEEINQAKIVYFQIFAEDSLQQVEDKNNIYGLVQVQETAQSFPIYYIHCGVQIDAQFVNPILKCRTISKTNLSRGKIIHMSQMFSTKQKIGAIVFSNQNTLAVLYNFFPTGFMYYGQIEFGNDYQNQMTGLQVTMKKQLIITFQHGKRLQVYNVEDIHHEREKAPRILMTIDHRVIAFFGIDYFAPTQTKISIYHDEVLFVKSKNGIMALNINEQGIPQLLFHIKTATSQYDFQVNRDTLVILTQKQMEMHRLTRPLRRINQPFLLQKFQADFNLNQYDDINSDGLFYLVEKQDTTLLVIHPDMPSTSVIYTQFVVGKILMIDSVKLNDKQVVMMWTGTQMVAYVFAINPKLKIRWKPLQGNFTFNVSAFNEQGKNTQAYSTKVQVLQSTQAFINATQKFNATAIKKLGHVQTKQNGKMDINITLNDTQWFTGNVMHYTAKCPNCNKNVSDKQFNIVLQNHLKKLNTDIHVGEPVYDLHSTFTGIFGQQFNSIFKTYEHNDSIQYIGKLPTGSMGEVCSKMAVHGAQDFVLSFCQDGRGVNVYITVTGPFKPFTYGPFQTQAQAVNHVQLVGNILMIVDNDDDPFNRAGGVYLYYLDFSARDAADMLNMLDYLDYADLQIEGFTGAPHVASADIQRPLFNKDQYAVFITQARTGNIFIFLFQVSANKRQAVYLQRRMLSLNTLIPVSVIKRPTPLRIININIVDYTVKNFFNEDGTPSARMQIQYNILLTVRNWHHVELMFVFDAQYDLLQFQLVRLYERVPYPWQLTNFIRLRKGALNASYFALSYRNYQAGSQVMVIYQLPYFKLSPTPAQGQAQSRESSAHDLQLQDSIPMTRMLGAHRVMDTSQICFAFNSRNQHRMLFNDAGSKQLEELQLNKQLKLIIKNADPAVVQQENIVITAENHYTNFSFIVELSLTYKPDDDNHEKVEIIWIIILVIGFLMIVGLIFVWSRQKKTQDKDSVNRESKQSLLTVQPEFKGNYINRSSADPESIRGTVEFVEPTPVPAPVPKTANGTKTMQKEQDKDEDEELKEDNPLEERLVEPAQKQVEAESKL